MSLPLSVLDLSPLSAGSSGAQALRNSVDLARHADGLGFHRYWVSEHHNLPSVVSTSPEVLIGHLANASRRMRVGSGGIMLPNHAPLRIAEAFRVLEALHPGRIDLGLGRAPGSDGRAAVALRRGRASGDDFPEMFDELLAFGGLEPFPAGSPIAQRARVARRRAAAAGVDPGFERLGRAVRGATRLSATHSRTTSARSGSAAPRARTRKGSGRRTPRVVCRNRI